MLQQPLAWPLHPKRMGHVPERFRVLWGSRARVGGGSSFSNWAPPVLATGSVMISFPTRWWQGALFRVGPPSVGKRDVRWESRVLHVGNPFRDEMSNIVRSDLVTYSICVACRANCVSSKTDILFYFLLKKRAWKMVSQWSKWEIIYSSLT